MALSILLGTAATLFTLNRRPDRAETRRLVAFAIGAPFMASGIVAPTQIAPLTSTIGLLVMLVGAPIEFDDHAQRAIRLAHQIRDVSIALTGQWSNQDMQLGMGVGVASGFATVGVIGGSSRLEYTAVGPPVNLASRLCSEASHGEVLVDRRTAELLRDSMTDEHQLQIGNTLQLKGFVMPVQSYLLATA